MDAFTRGSMVQLRSSGKAALECRRLCAIKEQCKRAQSHLLCQLLHAGALYSMTWLLTTQLLTCWLSLRALVSMQYHPVLASLLSAVWLTVDHLS